MADLRPYIYHEVQDRNGSMLCAQHCLNNLLQQHLYSEFDLADLAASLDAQENSHLDTSTQHKTSQNMDDTGFFSLDVLVSALQVFDLTLVRWRGEEMKKYHDHPENQSAFVLNLHSHWLPLRRFSTPSRWYNLNSFLVLPDWISPTYLQMVLAEAETEGYSVFVVRKLSDREDEIEKGKDVIGGNAQGTEGDFDLNGLQGVGVLPECEADMFALELGDPVGRAGAMENTLNNVTVNPASDHDSYASAARSASQPSGSGSGSGSYRLPEQSSPPTELDPVVASLARSKADLARFQAEQEAALMESRAYGTQGQGRRRRQGDVPDIFGGGGGEDGQGMDDEEFGGEMRPPQPMNRFQRQQAEEAEMMRQAIEESLRDARARGEPIGQEGGDAGDRNDNQGEPSRVSNSGDISRSNSTPVTRPTSTQPQSRSTTQAQSLGQPGTSNIPDDDEELDDPEDDLPIPVYDFAAQSRFYDDDDAALQAALSASLAQVPEGWAPPPPTTTISAAARRASQQGEGAGQSNPIANQGGGGALSAGGAPQKADGTTSNNDQAGAKTEDGEEEEEDDEPVEEVLSPEELRRKRLERFK